MGLTICYKILKDHLVKGELVKGNPISIKIDQTLTQDATGTMAYLEFESMGMDRVKNELAVSYVDHNTVQVGFENSLSVSPFRERPLSVRTAILLHREGSQRSQSGQEDLMSPLPWQGFLSL